MTFPFSRRAFSALFPALPFTAAAQPAAPVPAPPSGQVDEERIPPLGPAQSPDQLMERTRHRRAVEAAIWGMPAVNYDLMRQEMLKAGGTENQIIYWGRPLDWRNQTLTPNPDTLYFMSFFDLRVGPLVIEVPPGDAGGSLNGNIVNLRQMPLEDVGLLGVDRGVGGRFVLLPPGQAEPPLPAGYTALPCDTLGGYALFRANLASHGEEDVRRSLAYGRRVRIYPLAQAANPPPNALTDAKDVIFNSTIRYDASFFDNLNRIVQAEPWLPRDRLMINTLRSLGMERGKPFNPDAPTRTRFDAAMREVHAYLGAMYERGWEPFFANTNWRPAADAEFVKLQVTNYSDTEAYPSDLRGLAYTYGYIGLKRLGVGQFYLIAIHDKDGKALEGGQTYRLRVPPNVPVEQYWSVTAYDRESHALIRDMPRASRSSQVAEMARNADGSIDILFGPSAPSGRDANWIPTDPRRGFELMFRVYGPRPEFFQKRWVLPDMERI
ncbi:DUF1214 domain-containing protein [Roseicella sp. DB1501]|uniref:DUF1214 domain-containing protein n=1 Tax=Roseicella sp. DB1501 TaxID=2730925 RepID=UPI001C2C3C80|nr:DUF1254 domain-containing protein [Roseicella sp. DB1501]